jgi:PhnB protein
MSTTPSRSVSAYLNFEGRCEEALEFYKSALGAEVDTVMRFKEAPASDECPSGDPEKIMHSAFRIGSTMIMASDCQCSGKTAFAGVSLALDVPDEADAARCFEVLSAGGTVHMPLGKTFWSPSFGVVADKFGVCWMINAREAV